MSQGYMLCSLPNRMHEVGHNASVCKTKPDSDRKREFKETKYVEVDEEDTDDDEVLGIFTAKDSGKDGRTPGDAHQSMCQ